MSFDQAASRGRYLSAAACIALCLMSPLNGLAQSGLGPILPQMTAHFADEPNAGVLVRLMISGLAAAMILGALVSGFLAERFGELKVLLVCLLVFALAGAAGYLLDNLYLLVGTRFVLGAVTSAASGLGMALITTQVAPTKRPRWLGFFIVSGTVGSLVLMGVVGVLGQYDWRYVFLLYLLALPVAAFTALAFPRRDKPPLRAAGGPPVAGGGLPWRMMLLTMLIGAVGTTTFMYLPYHLAEIGRGSPEQLAPVMMVNVALASVGSAGYGWVRSRVGTIAMFVATLGLCAVSLVVIAATPDPVVIYVGVACFGLGFGLMMPHMYGSCAAAMPAIFRPRMIGLVRSTFYVGPLLAQVVLEMVLGRYGAGAAVASIALIAVAAALLAVLFRRSFVPVEEAPAHG